MRFVSTGATHQRPDLSSRILRVTRVALVAWAAGAQAGGLSLESVGARTGFSVRERNTRFYQSEAFADFNLPWHWDLGSEWHLQTRLDLSAGWLTGGGDDAFVGTVGPSLVLGREEFPLLLVSGISPTVLSREEVGPLDFGDVLQFTTHIGITWQVGKRVTLGYRFQHMSNANISDSNPGLNLHSFAVGYRF
jgi:hypothetical protein